MHLERKCLILVAMFTAAGAFAQQQPAQRPFKPQILPWPDTTVTYASAADVANLIATAKKERKDDAPLVVGRVLQLAPYTVVLEYRETTTKLADAGIHPKDDELVYVLDGSGTLVTGGKVAADHMSIEGGESKQLGKGDFVLIPAGTPHWINHVDQTMELIIVHMPQPATAQ